MSNVEVNVGDEDEDVSPSGVPGDACIAFSVGSEYATAQHANTVRTVVVLPPNVICMERSVKLMVRWDQARKG